MTQNLRTDRLLLLNDQLALLLLQRIQGGKATAQELNVARQFLKDNNIDVILRDYEAPEHDDPILKLAGEIAGELDEYDKQASG